VGVDGDGVPRKKRKAMDSSAAKQKRGAMDAIVDRGLSTEERAQVDLVLLRYAHLSATCVDDPITHTVRTAISPNNFRGPDP